jgi:molybdenum cofactor synthesis domain-containing protein
VSSPTPEPAAPRTEHRRRVGTDELAEPLLAYDEAIARIVASFEPLAPAEQPLDRCLGLVVAADVVTDDDVPAFDNSAMDGYAVRSDDLSGGAASLRIGDRIAPGVATKVMTGQPVPDGADAVVPWEQAEAEGDTSVRARGPVPAGTFVRRRGEDLQRGTTVLRAGSVLDPVAIGLAASIGRASLLVQPRPRVGVLSTGDELVDVVEPIGRGRVRDANGPLLAALAERAGAVPSERRRTGDDPGAITEALHQLAAVSDLVVTSGGASVGEKDWLRVVLERAGELSFWRIAMRPGKPVALGRIDGTPVVVLPGNPGSVVACSHVVLARAVRRLAGRSARPSTVRATLGAALAGDPERTVVHPVVLDGEVATPVASRTSQVLSNALGAHGWVIVPPGGSAEGDEVEVELS